MTLNEAIEKTISMLAVEKSGEQHPEDKPSLKVEIRYSQVLGTFKVDFRKHVEE